jgi:hypothetical protein
VQVLSIRGLSSESERKIAFQKMTPTQKYWYKVLFPKWFSSRDERLHIWQQELMAKNSLADDDVVIQNLGKMIQQRQGTFLHRYLADFSLATDLIVSYSPHRSLCVQITTVSGNNLLSKYRDWKATLEKWDVPRGLIISYNPSQSNYLQTVAKVALEKSNNLPEKQYLKICY